MTSDGKPFFWLADTAWELFHRLDEKEASFYLDTRKEQGFNVVQAVVLAELDGIQTPNANGDTPFSDLEKWEYNEAYFEHVDHILIGYRIKNSLQLINKVIQLLSQQQGIKMAHLP